MTVNSLLEKLLSYAIPIVSVYVAYLLGRQRSKSEKKVKLAERRLSQFYSPIVGCIQKIITMGELRVDIHETAQRAWRKICDRHKETYWDSENEFLPFKNIIDYDNKQLIKEILPQFETILAIFTENYWLAFSSTKQYYPEVYNFIEIWKRNNIGAIPKEIIEELGHTQKKLEPFFGDIIDNLSKLEKYLAGDISYRKLNT